jgi:arylsulfatase A-like enzyme
VLLCNLKLDVQGRRPAIIDVAPTVLAFFGIERPGHMDGHAIGLANRGAE